MFDVRAKLTATFQLKINQERRISAHTATKGKLVVLRVGLPVREVFKSQLCLLQLLSSSEQEQKHISVSMSINGTGAFLFQEQNCYKSVFVFSKCTLWNNMKAVCYLESTVLIAPF